MGPSGRYTMIKPGQGARALGAKIIQDTHEVPGAGLKL